MISVGQITNAGGAASYYTEEQDRLEYYQGEKSPSEWKGAGAKISGIEGEQVTREGMEAMLSGKVREIGESGFIEERQLGRTRVDKETGEKKLEHRAGWDFTFSAPKSVSIEAEVFGRSDVLDAHREAVDKAMGYLERHAQARIDGKTENTGNLTYAQFEHATTRAGDPQAHTHVVVTNLTYGENGKAYSLESKGMYEARHAADNVYKNELARSLQEKGYQVEWNNTGDFEIKGYAREQIEAFSKRSEEIKEELAERGVTKAEASAQERQIAALDSRQAKNHPESREAHQERWLKEADEIGIKPAERSQEGGEKANGKEAAREAVGKAMSHITEREAAFKESELYKEAARFSQGGASLEELDRAVRDAKASGGLVDRGDGKFTTREMTTLEDGVGKRIEEGKGAHQRVMDKTEFERALKDFEARKSKEKGQSFKLSEEQRGAAGMILTGNDRFQGVQGLAGTGKTTMLEFVREAAEKKGWEVKGFSNGAAQAQKLQEESGIGSQTTRSFLNERRSGAQAARKDAELARGALATYEGRTVSARKLEKIAADPATKKEWDSKGRVYLRAKDGRVYQPALHSGKRSIESRNLNHAGLTKTRYVIGEKGVFKQGGTLKSELAGKINDRIQAGIRRDYHKGLDRVRADVAKSGGRAGAGAQLRAIGHGFQRALRSDLTRSALRKHENWRKAGVIESVAVRATAWIQQTRERAELVKDLKGQAGLMDKADGARKVLHIHDEASQSGVKEFTDVMSKTEREGARTVFLGDRNQHQAVEAGKAFEQAQRHLPMNELTDIRRQKTEEAKGIVKDVLEGRHGEAMARPAIEVRGEQDKVREKWEGRELSEKDRQTMRAEMRGAARADNQRVVERIAKDYAALPQRERGKTAILTSTNVDRRAVNDAVREQLKAKGELGRGKEFAVLEKKDMTGAERRAAAYERGDVVKFTSEYRALNVEKGAEGRVVGKDDRTNRVSVELDGGRVVQMRGDLKGVEASREVKREFAEGDKIAFSKNDRETGFKNGHQGKVLEIREKSLVVEMNGERRTVDLEKYRNIDHGYAMTSMKAQGQTVDRAMIHHNTESGRHGDRETYVNVTRARMEVKVYTQDVEKAKRQAGFKMDKETARPEREETRQERKEERRGAERETPERNQVDKETTKSVKSRAGKEKEDELEFGAGR